MSCTLREFKDGDQSTCERILRALPEWFGIESALVQYVQDALRYPTWVAEAVGSSGETVGFITVHEHNAKAAEIHCIAVLPEFHRCGIGRLMIEHVEQHLRSRGFDFLQVKTLGPSRPCPEYERTRKFYEAIGFVPLEEFPNLWPGNPCLLMVKRL